MKNYYIIFQSLLENKKDAVKKFCFEVREKQIGFVKATSVHYILV